jgi:putative heme-binding domain-containing protein
MKTDFKPLTTKPPAARLAALAELHETRWNKVIPCAELVEVLRKQLNNTDPNVRLFALRWVAEEHLTELLPEVEKLLDAPQQSERYFLAVLAAFDWLSREPEQRHTGISDGLLARELRNSKRSFDVKTLALNLMSPDYKDLTLDMLAELVQNTYEPLQIAAARTLAQQTNSERFPVLVKIAEDPKLSDAVRVEALAGMASVAEEHRKLLETYAAGTNSLAKEAQRILRLSGLSPAKFDEQPDAGDFDAWVKLLAVPGNVDSGRRLFFSDVGPRCSACHRHSGRGGNIGPDLTNLAASNSRERVIRSILDPSREVAPHYETWILVTDNGKTHVGQRLPKGGDDGVEPYADTAGKEFELESEAITHREPSKSSIMPAGLQKSLTVEDLRDLLTFLMQ